MIFPFGSIDVFAGVDLNTANIKPLRCRLRAPSAARILTLANGQAFNDGRMGATWPVEQVLEVIIHGNAPGGGLVVDNIFQLIATKQGTESTLRVRVPPGSRTYSAPAVLDYLEVSAEGNMSDDDSVNWVVLALHFSQIGNWTAG